MTLFLGLDVGTQGTKGLLLDADTGRVVARAGRGYGLIEGLPRGAAEQHPDTWIEAVREVARELGREVGGVGVSGQQHGLVLLDEKGAVLRPAKLWCDTSTADEAQELGVPAGYTAPKILWVKRHEPQVWSRARHVLLPHDYVNFRLTGTLSMEAGDASGTGLFDVAHRAWDRARIDALDPRLSEMLPPLGPPGLLSAEGAALLGQRAGIPVAAGGGDNMMSALGSGATRPGIFVVSLGTSGTVFTFSDRPIVDPEGLIAPFCDSTGGWLPLLCVMNCTGVLEEVRAAFGSTHEELTRAAEQVPPGCDGLLVVPYLQGERVPNLPLATGALHGVRPGLLRPGRVYRAALEGVSLNLAWGVERMRALGLAVDSVRLVGGGARNLLWRQILADCLEAPVTALVESESAALGAAIAAAWTAGVASLEALVERCVRHETGTTTPRASRRDALHRFRDLAGR